MCTRHQGLHSSHTGIKSWVYVHDLGSICGISMCVHETLWFALVSSEQNPPAGFIFFSASKPKQTPNYLNKIRPVRQSQICFLGHFISFQASCLGPVRIPICSGRFICFFLSTGLNKNKAGGGYFISIHFIICFRPVGLTQIESRSRPFFFVGRFIFSGHLLTARLQVYTTPYQIHKLTNTNTYTHKSTHKL